MHAAKSKFNHFIATRNIQSCWRAHLALQLLKKHLVARQVQTAWRLYKAQSLLQKHFAARTLQNTWRSIKARETLVLHVTKFVAASLIQANWRGYSAVGEYIMTLGDVITAQSACRRYAARAMSKKIRHEKQEAAAVTLQKSWRSFFCSAKYFMEISDIIIAQSRVRSWLAKRELQQLRHQKHVSCSLLVQKTWRCRASRGRFLKKKSDIVSVQSCARALFARRQFQSLLQERKERCAVAIQKSWRGFKCFSDFVTTLANIVTLQCIARRFLANIKLRAQCAIVLQKSWRRFTCSSDYAYTLAGVVTVQGVARSLLAKRQMLLLVKERNNQCAILLQKVWRCYSAYARYIVDLSDIITVQSCARRLQALQLAKNIQSDRDNRHVTNLQKAWRRFSHQIKFRKTLAHIVTIQSCARRLFALKEKQQRAAVLLQNAWRSYVCSSSYALIVADITVAQSLVRRYLAKKYFARRWKEHQIGCSVTIQLAWRAHLCKTSYVLLRADIIVAQSQVRTYLARKNYLAKITVLNNSNAITIQKVWRSYFCQSHYRLVLSDIISAQSQVRQYFAKKEAATRLRAKRHICATTVQSCWRSYFAYTSYAIVYADIVRLQALVRSLIAKRTFDRLANRRRTMASTSIQKTWRSHSSRMSLKREKAAVKVQASWRSYFVYTTYAIIYSDIVKVQSFARSLLAKRTLRAFKLERQSDAALTIQTLFRSVAARSIANEKKMAVATHQRQWRGYRCRVELFLAWKEHEKKIYNAATQIQKNWRCYCQRQDCLYTIGCAVAIQSAFRMALVMRKAKKEHEAATIIQCNSRRFSARMEAIKHMSTFMLEKARNHLFGCAALKIQCVWQQKCLRQRLQSRKIAIENQIQAASICIAAFFMMAKCRRMLLKTIAERKQETAATTLQHWYLVASRVRRKRRNRAGRKIYIFLKMVKAEVDREVRAEKKRRKMRQKMRNRTHEKDEELLEGAWEKMLYADCPESKPQSRSRRTRDKPRRSNSMSSGTNTHFENMDIEAVISQSPTRNEQHNRRLSESAMDSMPHRCDSNISEPLKGNKYDRRCIPRGNSRRDEILRRSDSTRSDISEEQLFVTPPVIGRSSNATLPPVPPRYYYNDRCGMGQGYDVPVGSANYRVPRPRTRKFNQVQIEEDLNLEEAYLDMEISEAKERRMADKLMKQQERRSGSSSRSRSRIISGGSSVMSASSSRTYGSSKSKARPNSTARAGSATRAGRSPPYV